LFREGVLSSPSLDLALNLVVCDSNRMKCMYRECDTCKNNSIRKGSFDEGKVVTCFEWKTKRMEYTSADNKVMNTIRTVKEQSTMALIHLVRDFDLCLREKVVRHVFNIRNQYKMLRILKESLRDDECVIHMDFSENFSCQYSEEIQAVHFGSSHQQASLHTGIVYVSESNIPFCTLSACTRHDPSAIWAHLDPILCHVRSAYPLVVKVHFVSDGPTTQYRNKSNFYFFSQIIYDKGFTWGSWNFMEAGHGKGAPDGIGASIKRKCDAAIAHGTDVKDARAVFDVLISSESNNSLWFIEEESVLKMSAMLSNLSLATVQGTMKIHQVYSTARSTISHRVLSCFCRHPLPCECMSLKKT